MLDINFVRKNEKAVKASEKKRGNDPERVDEVLRSDEKWKKELKVMEKLKHQRNIVSEEINQAKKSGKNSLVDKKIKEMKGVVDKIKKQENKVNKLLKKRDEALTQISNVLHYSVPKGKDESDNVEIKKVGKIPKFNFKIRDHIELAEELDLMELDTAAKVSGARFYYLKNEAVLLDLALQRFVVDRLLAKGYTLIYPPFMLNKAALEGGVNLSEFEDTIYKVEDEDLYLIGTSEHPLVALKQNQILQENELPIFLCGVSTCFRKEAGSHGRDTKGIFRVHQFNKVEQVVYCRPEESDKYFKMLQVNAEDLFKELGIPFRVVNICTGDLGDKQSLQYDIEAWFPGQKGKKGAYREITSCSNCLDYQAVTLNTKFIRKDGTKEYVHMLNNTAVATARAIVAILENFQTKDGTVRIPKALWPYMNGIKEIKKK